MQNPPLAVDQVINPSVSVFAKIIAHAHTPSFAERFPHPMPECCNRSADRIPSHVSDGDIAARCVMASADWLGSTVKPDQGSDISARDRQWVSTLGLYSTRSVASFAVASRWSRAGGGSTDGPGMGFRCGKTLLWVLLNSSCGAHTMSKSEYILKEEGEMQQRARARPRGLNASRKAYPSLGTRSEFRDFYVVEKPRLLYISETRNFMEATGTVVSDITFYCQYVLSHDKRVRISHDGLGPCLTGILGSG